VVIAGVTGLQIAALKPALSQESAIEACKVWQAIGPAQPGSIDKLIAYFKGLFTLKSEPAQPVATGQLYFTNQSSFSRQPRCLDAQPIGARLHFYLPAGIVARKLGELSFAKDKYWLVETEYGLRTFVKESNLSPVERDKVYFFADAPADNAETQKKFCLEQSAKPCTSAEHRDNKYLSPKSLYAVALLKDFAVYDGENFALQRTNPDADRKCGTIKVGLYDGSGQRKELGRLNTCDESDRGSVKSNRLDRRIKVVRSADYEAYFARGIVASVSRIESGVLAKIAPEFAYQKLCNDKFEFKSESEVGIKAGASIKFMAAIELGGSANKKYVWTLQQQLSEKMALYSHVYALQTDKAEARVDSALIQIRYGCEEDASVPQRLTEIRISSPLRDPAADFIFSNEKTAEDKSAKQGMEVSFTGRGLLFNQGFAFQIVGQKDYFRMRDMLFKILRTESADLIRDLYKDGEDNLYRSRMTSFFAHLVLAAAGKPYLESDDGPE